MDWTEWLYIISGFLIFVVIIVAIVAQAKVYSAYDKYSKKTSSLGLTGQMLAQKLCEQNNLALTIRSCNGKLSDHYNPKDKSINISQENFNSSSVASIAIVAHEFGHAMQDQEEYAPLKIRQFAIKVSSFASKALLPFLIVSILLSIFIGYVGTIMLFVVVVVYGLSLFVNLVTLPVEIDASNRAKVMLGEMITDEEEQKSVKKMLSAAAMTYVASMLVSLVYFLRFLSLFLMSRRD